MYLNHLFIIMNRCHICLEDVDTSEEIIKDCCDAFICNECWIKLRDNPETIQCPICKSSIYNIPQMSNTVSFSTFSFCDNYYKCIKNTCSFTAWFIIGYLVVVIVSFWHIRIIYNLILERYKIYKYLAYSTFGFWLDVLDI